MLAILLGEIPGQQDEVADARVDDPVHNLATPPLRGCEPAPLEACQVVGHASLRGADDLDELPHRAFSLQQSLQDLQARGIPHDPEIAGQGTPGFTLVDVDGLRFMPHGRESYQDFL